MKLATRLAVAFALVATLPLLAIAPLFLREVREAFAVELDQREEAAAGAVAAEVRALEAGIVRALDAVAASERLRSLAADEDDPAAIVPVAGELMAARGLDVLALLDGDGRVLSSGHLPARVGDPDQATLELALQRPGEVQARFVERLAEGGIREDLALVAARPIAAGPGDAADLFLVVGRTLGHAFAEKLAAGAGSDIALVQGERVLAVADAPEDTERGPALAELLPAPAPRTRLLPLAGDVQIRMRTSARSLAVAQARIVGMLGLLLLAAVALATLLGVVLARRIVRPVEALARGATRVARGDLDHRVEVAAGAEVGALVGAFNRMTSDLRRERERAAVAERIAAWQEVARRLAHEIKNPLTPIAMSVETLRDAHRARSPLLDEIFEESSAVVLEEVARLQKIVDEFSRFARLPPPALETVAVRELVAPLLALYATPPPGITFHADIDEGLPLVRVDRDQILQVLLNLVANAENAMEGRGAVRLAARAAPGGVVLSIDDEGPGVAPADRERIFEPYVTGSAGGTGLGLAISRRIAEEHGGSLEVEEAPGRGASFRLRLPAAAPHA